MASRQRKMIEKLEESKTNKTQNRDAGSLSDSIVTSKQHMRPGEGKTYDIYDSKANVNTRMNKSVCGCGLVQDYDVLSTY